MLIDAARQRVRRRACEMCEPKKKKKKKKGSTSPRYVHDATMTRCHDAMSFVADAADDYADVIITMSEDTPVIDAVFDAKECRRDDTTMFMLIRCYDTLMP